VALVTVGVGVQVLHDEPAVTLRLLLLLVLEVLWLCCCFNFLMLFNGCKVLQGLHFLAFGLYSQSGCAGDAGTSRRRCVAQGADAP